MASEETKTPALPATSEIEAENATEIRRISVVTELQLSDISDDVGTCWRELGPKLDIPAAKIQNLDNDYCCSRDKANALLLLWKQKEGRNALVGCLADALVSIGKKCIAEKLLGLDVISLIVIHSLDEGLDELLICEDAQGNKYMVKAFNSSDNFLKLEEHQDLRLQMQKGPLACGNVAETDGIKDASKDKKEPTCSLLNEEVDPTNYESVEKLLQSCEEHSNFFQRMFDVLIKLTAEVGQQSEDNVNLIQPLSDFTMELQQEKITLFSKIESVPTQSQLSDERHVDRAEKLHKWKRRYEVRFEEAEKLMSYIKSNTVIHQKITEGEPNNRGRLNSVPECSSRSLSGLGEMGSRRYSESDKSKKIKMKNLFSRRGSEDK
ncbi:uncharacterized protein [Pocillopora verrucosa]|uniref:uncharacterized protein n=1 Tax=Pocillopora verrucosa TaxID=203993 RepID=UPI00333EA1D4